MYNQEEGVPQGAILSTTLFNVKLNGIANEISPNVHCSLYVDDFVIFIRSSTIEAIERQLQICIRKVMKWTTRNGFTISAEKTVAMHFCNCNSVFCRDPVLKLGSQDIRVVTEFKFLGLIWDPKLTFIPHIRDLKKKCQKAMNIIKFFLIPTGVLILEHYYLCSGHWSGQNWITAVLFMDKATRKLLRV